MQESFVPIKDDGFTKSTLERSNSLGSDKDVLLHTAGQEDSLDYRIHAKHAEGKTISLWHDIR